MSIEKKELKKHIKSTLNFEILDSIDSTNLYIKRNLSELDDGFFCVTLNQNAGIGRNGRVWQANEGTCLALSILKKTDTKDFQVSQSSILMGFCVQKTLKTLFCDADFKIKWPNDILANGKKICGILGQSVISADGVSLVLGAGINLSQSEDDFLQAGLTHAASLKMISKEKIEIEKIISGINNLFFESFEILKEAEDLSPFLEEIRENCITLSKHIKIAEHENQREAFALDISRGGHLIVKEADGRISEISGGEVSIRALDGYA